MSDAIRPTKKQRELLGFIEEFIKEHGYSPSYREIMNGAGYNSVATVALHVNSLVARGHLVKRGRSARSLEVVSDGMPAASVVASGESWLLEQVEAKFAAVEKSGAPPAELETLVAALGVLGLEEQSRKFASRLRKLL